MITMVLWWWSWQWLNQWQEYGIILNTNWNVFWLSPTKLLCREELFRYGRLHLQVIKYFTFIHLWNSNQGLNWEAVIYMTIYIYLQISMVVYDLFTGNQKLKKALWVRISWKVNTGPAKCLAPASPLGDPLSALYCSNFLSLCLCVPVFDHIQSAPSSNQSLCATEAIGHAPYFRQ